MKPLNSDTWPEEKNLDEQVRQLTLVRHDPEDKLKMRDMLRGVGYSFKRLDPHASPMTLLAADCALAARQLKYHALWATHAVSVHAAFDGACHPDNIIGHSSIPYKNLMYSNAVGIGEIVPYQDVEARAGYARICEESKIFLQSLGRLGEMGFHVDCLLVDGSLHTNLETLKAAKGKNPEADAAFQAFEEVMGFRRVVGLVEDSHATNVASALGFDYTDMLLFDTALEPYEYVSSSAGGISVCHVKLPGKPLPHQSNAESEPLTVRWEFNYPGFEDDLGCLAGMWLMEDDILHPQVYPVRIADHLTRRIKVGGILEKAVLEHGLAPKHRDLRVW